MKCSICLQEFSDLKSNCHVIPRFLVKKTKINGKNVFIKTDGVHDRNQQDIVVDNKWCAACELLFKADDDFAKDFFDNKKFYKTQYLFDSPELNKIGYEVHDVSCCLDLKKFFISILLRYDIYEIINNGKSLLGPHFETLRNCYANKKITSEEYPMAFLKYSDLDEMLGYPTRERYDGINAIFVLLKEYRLWMYVDKQHRYEKSFEEFLVNDSHVRGLILPSEKTKFKKDLLRHIGKITVKE